jgi:nucleoside-diphosphate-sugar epimerase
MAWISAEDAAELSRVALLEPRRFAAGVNYVAGSELYSHQQVVEMLGDLVGRSVTFEAIDRERWRAELLKLSDADGQSVVNPAMAQHISAIGHAVAAQGASSLPADPARLADLLGRAPRTLREFLAANRSLFASTATP